MSSKRKSHKATPAVATIVVVILLAHSLATGSAAWFLAGALFLGALMLRGLYRHARRSTKRRHGVYYRRRLHVLPFVWLNISRSPSKGWSHSWTTKIGPWSHNSRTDRDR